MHAHLALLKRLLDDVPDALRPAKKRLEAFRAQWGKPGNRDGFLAERHFELAGRRAGRVLVDDKTWADLEFPRIFARMDTCVTFAGRQMLFHRLRRLDAAPTEIEQRHATCRILADDPPLREKIQMTLWRPGKRMRSHLTDYLFGDTNDTPRHKAAWLAWSLACVAVFAVAIFARLPAWAWIGVLFVNFVLMLKTHWQVTRDNEAMLSCMALLDTADALAALHEAHPGVPPFGRLHERGPARARMRRALRWLCAVKHEPVAWLSIWLNAACALELLLHAFTIDRFVRLRETVAPDFELMGDIDAAIAVASFMAGYEACCRPEPTTAPELVVIDGCHPLLPDGVTNSIRLEHRSALVTGSNMAGKTTFIKMLGTNVILAQTFGFCLATRAVVPRVRVLASIQGSHSVASGKSHYFAEVERINSFFDAGDDGYRNLLVIDELFSGTNTTERVAIARAVLESLARDSIVLATTHDVELQTALDAHFDYYHFQEDPQVDGFFDYRLRPGITHARNAIRMLGEMGFPAPVIASAMDYATGTARTA